MATEACVFATGTTIAPLAPIMRPGSVEEARSEVNQLAFHLEALMLTNRALLEQLAEAKRRAASVETELGEDAARAQMQRAARGRRARDDDDDDDEFDERPKYRCADERLEPIAILSRSAGPQDEFDHALGDDMGDDDASGSITFRGSGDGDSPYRASGLSSSAAGDSRLHLDVARLKDAVAALGALAALGDGAKDHAVLAALDRLRACGC